MDIFEAANRFLNDKYSIPVKKLNESTSKKSDLNDGDIVWYKNGEDWLKGKLVSDGQISTNGTKFWMVNSFTNRLKREDIKTPQEMIDFRNKNKKSKVNESTNESIETYFKLNDLKKLLKSKEIGVEDWEDRDGTKGFTIFLKRYNGKHAQFTKPITKEQFEKIQDKLLNLVSGKIWTVDEMRKFINSDKTLSDNVQCVEFVLAGPGEYDSEDNFFVFKNKNTGKEFTLNEPLNDKELRDFFLKNINKKSDK